MGAVGACQSSDWLDQISKSSKKGELSLVNLWIVGLMLEDFAIYHLLPNQIPENPLILYKNKAKGALSER